MHTITIIKYIEYILEFVLLQIQYLSGDLLRLVRHTLTYFAGLYCLYIN